MTDTPNRAESGPATDPVPVTHLALLLGNPDDIPDLAASLRYKGMAVIGASPLDDIAATTPGTKGLTDYLSEVSSSILSGSDIKKVHVLQFPGAEVDVDSIVASLHRDYKGVDVARVPMKTEKGARAYFEEAHSLVPEDPRELDEGEEIVRDLLADSDFKKKLLDSMGKLQEAGLLGDLFGFGDGVPEPVSPDSESGDRDQDTSGGLERVEPRTLSEAKIYLEGRNDHLVKEVERLTGDNRGLSEEVTRLEDRVTGLLHILDRVSQAFVK